LTFEEFNFCDELKEGLHYMHFDKATPIQEQAIPVIISKRDLIGCAQTGTGKTAAFLLPIIDKLTRDPKQTTNTLIIVPTRELAIQIDEALQAFSYFTPVSSIAIYGGNNGNAFETEKRALTEGINIIISTPGRLIAHLNMGYVKFDQVQHLILDEADRMLDMGFVLDLTKIISHLPAMRQTIMFSATMPEKIRVLAKKILNDPFEINIALSKPAEGVTQTAYMVYDKQKIPLMSKILTENALDTVIVFCSTKDKVKELEKDLRRAKFDVAAIHSDLEQDQRNEVLRNFKSKKLKIVVATDVLSRGIDIDSIGMVVNYDVPGDAEDYVHRVGRTARAETKGKAITFINPDDQKKFHRIEKLIDSVIPKTAFPDVPGEFPAYDVNNLSEKKKGGSKGGQQKRKWSNSKPSHQKKS